MNKPSGPLIDRSLPGLAEAKIAPSLERRRLRTYILMLIADGLMLHAAFIFAAYIYEGVWWQNRTMLAAQTILPLYFTIALYNSTYSGRALRDWIFGARQAVIAIIISAAMVNFIAFYMKANAEFSRVAVTLGLVLFLTALVWSRWAMIKLIGMFWGGRTRNFLVIDDEGPKFSLDTADVISAKKFGIDPTGHDPFMLDRLGKLLRNQDKVVVSCDRSRRLEWAFLLKSSGVHGEIVSEPAHDLGALGVHRYVDPARTTLVVSTGPLGLRGRVGKRAFDMVVASAGLLALSPVLLIVAAAIKLEDGGPVFFIQRRLGRGNQFFDMYKFRSMRVDNLDADGARSTGRSDDRITRIGAFIRRTSIDELPQILNVLRGEMSIVGPRPHALGSRANNKYFWEVDQQYWQRHCLKPGLTGLAQVRGHRGATEQEKDLTDRLQSDLEYVSRWSLLTDFIIVLKTIAVLRHDNAY